MSMLLTAAGAIEAVVRRIAGWTSWLMIVLMVVICFDVVSRKMGFQIPGMGSTRLQELEWHLHTVLFAMWLGYCYILNAHPRVDTITAHRSLRSRAWIELVGCLLFALPYAGIVAWYGIGFVATSFANGEGSEAVIGIPQRWVIKFLFVLGLWLLVAAILSVLLRTVVFLFGARELADRAHMNIERVPEPI